MCYICCECLCFSQSTPSTFFLMREKESENLLCVAIRSRPGQTKAFCDACMLRYGGEQIEHRKKRKKSTRDLFPGGSQPHRLIIFRSTDRPLLVCFVCFCSCCRGIRIVSFVKSPRYLLGSMWSPPHSQDNNDNRSIKRLLVEARTSMDSRVAACYANAGRKRRRSRA